jgi:hypothetical protein
MQHPIKTHGQHSLAYISIPSATCDVGQKEQKSTLIPTPPFSLNVNPLAI